MANVVGSEGQLEPAGGKAAESAGLGAARQEDTRPQGGKRKGGGRADAAR